MERERLAEILAAYGADPARWPADEREDARVALSSDLPLRRMSEETAVLDATLAIWARQDPRDDDALALAAADAALRAANRPVRRWRPTGLFGGAAVAVAAAVAAVLVLSPAQTSVSTSATPVAAPMAVASNVDPVDSHIWSMTFTPTPDEETLI